MKDKKKRKVEKDKIESTGFFSSFLNLILKLGIISIGIVLIWIMVNTELSTLLKNNKILESNEIQLNSKIKWLNESVNNLIQRNNELVSLERTLIGNQKELDNRVNRLKEKINSNVIRGQKENKTRIDLLEEKIKSIELLNQSDRKKAKKLDIIQTILSNSWTITY